jgi:hypothetical protein
VAPGAIITSASTTDRLLQVPIEIRPDIGASLTARLADKLRFDIGQANVIGPPLASLSAEPGPMAALVVRAIDEDAAHAG